VGLADAEWPVGIRDASRSRRRSAALVCRVGKTELRYHLRAIEDLHAMLKANGEWVPLGNADEQKPTKGGDGRVVGSLGRQPRRRVVRAEEGATRSLRELRASRSRGPRPGRGRASASEQSDAREVTRRLLAKISWSAASVGGRNYPTSRALWSMPPAVAPAAVASSASPQLTMRVGRIRMNSGAKFGNRGLIVSPPVS
jgi:hypothetical protein